MLRPRNPEQALKDLGRRVAELRQDRGWTQEKLAERADWSLKYVQRIEAGRANLTIRSLVGLSNLLGVEVRVFLEAPHSREVRQGRPRKVGQC